MTQVHNASPATKIELRRRLIEALGGPASCRVLETHSGPGIMRRGAYSGAREWIGIDTDIEAPGAVHYDSTLVLRAIDLSAFNLFDVDAFGSPWHHVWLVSQRRRLVAGERLGLAMTNGAASQTVARHMRPRRAGWSRQMLDTLGADPDASLSQFICDNAERTAQVLVGRWFAPGRIVRWMTARSPSGSTFYFAAIIAGAAES